jgi:hypothetical protein
MSAVVLQRRQKRKEKKCQKKLNFRRKRVKKEGRSYFCSPQKCEDHSHIASFDEKEWHSSFAPSFGSGVALKRVALFNTLEIKDDT